MERLAALSLAYLTVLVCSAQDAHYWTEQYGTKSKLLGGAVIGGVDDMGATFYNPGRLGLTEDPSFLLSAKVYELTKLKIIDGAGDGENTSDSDFGTAPSLLAGSFKIKPLKDHFFAYSLLTRQQVGFSATIRTANTSDILPGSPGDELLGGEVISSQKLKEEWFGFTWSYAIGSRFSVGITNYLTVRDQKTAYRVILEAINDQSTTASAIRLNEFNYKANGLLWKVGFALDLQPFTAGLTITTPRINLGGKGKRFFDSFNSGGVIDGDEGFEDLFIANQQKGLDPTYSSPLSVGLGTAYQLGKGKFHFSLEWFEGVGKYEVISPTSFLAQSTGETIRLPVVQELKSVLNYGFGAEYAFNNIVSVYGSFITDFTAVSDDINRIGSFGDETNSSVSNWNLYHLAGGTVLRVKQKAEVTFGISSAFASQEIPRLVNLPGDDVSGPIFDSGATTDLKFTRWTFVLGFSIDL